MNLRARHSGAISFLSHRCQMCWRRQEKGEVLPHELTMCQEAVPALASCLRHKVRTTTLTCHNPEHISPLCSTHPLPLFSSPPSLHLSFSFPSFPSFPFSSTVLSPPERAGEFVFFSGYITSCLWNQELIGTVF